MSLTPVVGVGDTLLLAVVVVAVGAVVAIVVVAVVVVIAFVVVAANSRVVIIAVVVVVLEFNTVIVVVVKLLVVVVVVALRILLVFIVLLMLVVILGFVTTNVIKVVGVVDVGISMLVMMPGFTVDVANRLYTSKTYPVVLDSWSVIVEVTPSMLGFAVAMVAVRLVIVGLMLKMVKIVPLESETIVLYSGP